MTGEGEARGRNDGWCGTSSPRNFETWRLKKSFVSRLTPSWVCPLLHAGIPFPASINCPSSQIRFMISSHFSPFPKAVAGDDLMFT
jgi:hypothetical protein